MKYIGTKNGIYDFEKSIYYKLNGEKERTPYCKDFEENPSDCKIADAIEELVDTFVIIDKESKKRSLDVAIENCIALLDDYEIYGSIWVGADLKAVAKMNEKGELELV